MNIEAIIFWITLFTYVSVFCFAAIGFVYQKEKLGNTAVKLLWLALLFHTVTAIIRWATGNHPPVTNTYELNLTGTWFTILLFVFFERIGKVEKVIGLIVIPFCFLIMGYGYLTGIEIKPMGPAFQSPWLIVHVIFAWLAFGSYAIATGASVFFLIKTRKPSWNPLNKITDPLALDLSSYRFVILGFINHAVMLVSGAIWAKKLWGTYWNWDPLETWSLISFLFYAFYLHTRSFLGWKMEKAAWLCITGLFILAVSFWGVGLFGPTIHPGP